MRREQGRCAACICACSMLLCSIMLLLQLSSSSSCRCVVAAGRSIFNIPFVCVCVCLYERRMQKTWGRIKPAVKRFANQTQHTAAQHTGNNKNHNTKHSHTCAMRLTYVFSGYQIESALKRKTEPSIATNFTPAGDTSTCTQRA